jgi:threonyl-tRNA synthetase
MTSTTTSLTEKRHTLAHLLAAAVAERYPHAKPTIGPALDNGFYYDFDFSAVTDAPGEGDLASLEEAMRELLPTWETMQGIEISEKDARARFAGNPFKLELIDEIVSKGETMTLYTAGDFSDLCRGGHSEHPAHEIKPDSFTLDRIAGAYWRGDEKNPQLTRIYGLAFETKDDLEAYKVQVEEAKKRDHKKLGKELDLFVFSDVVGRGLPLFTPKGSTIRRELERFIVDEEIKRGYQHVYTPDIAKLELYEKSGHYPHYKHSMYAPIDIDGDKFMLRPMTCPHHFELYLRKPASYRDLPMRIAELAQLYRYEQSGELSGLQRVRTFCLADAHIICASEEQAIDEVSQALDLIEYIAGVFGLVQGENYWYRLSLGDRSDAEKYYKDDYGWETGEKLLRELLVARGGHFVEAEGEAAFYGPKIDIQMKNVNGKEDTAFTVQYDFCMPERFNLSYTDQDGKERRAFVVHRSSIGAIERIMAFLIEQYAGAFPTWLAPVQVRVLPISEEKHSAYAAEVCATLKEAGVRVEVDQANESLGKKIRSAKTEKIPYLLVIGDAEIEAKTASVESRDQGKLDAMMIPAFIEKILLEIKNRA